MRYEYTNYLPGGTGKLIRRPMVGITIFGPSGSLRDFALVDSGADRTLFNIQVAQTLGIDLSHARKSFMHGIVGGKDALTVVIEIQPDHLDKITIPISFIDSNSFSSLLGQEGFFDQHRIKFEKDHNVFEINPVRKK